MDSSASNLIYLIKCAINGKTPCLNKIENIEKVLKLADSQSVIPYIYTTLEKAGCKEILRFLGYMNKNIAKSALQDYYREQVSEKLTSLSVPHVFLKGKDVVKFMPKDVQRFSCDVDVFYPEKYKKQVDGAMLSLGFTSEITGEIHQAYFIEPCVNFEMHFKSDIAEEDIYADFTRLDKLDGYLYQMKDEDIYIYNVMHAAKHFKTSGIGLRALTDVYLISKKVDTKSSYVIDTLKKINLLEFEYHFLTLAEICFENKESSDFYLRMLDFILKSGTYGSEYNKNLVQTKSDDTPETASKKQLRRRMFPKLKDMAILYPVLKKAPILLPFAWFWRLITAGLFKQKKIKREMKIINSLTAEEIKKNKEMFEKLNLN